MLCEKQHNIQQKQLHDILSAARAPTKALKEIPNVVQSCMVCRDWKKPLSNNVAAFRLTLEFNEEVQFDIILPLTQ